MHFLAEIAAAFGDVTFEMHMNVFVADVPGEASGLDGAPGFVERGLDPRYIALAEHAGQGRKAAQPRFLHRDFLRSQKRILGDPVGKGEQGAGLGRVAA